MPYSTQYSKERHSLAETYIAKANALKEGRVLAFSLPSQEEAAKLVWLLHDYIHLVGCSQLYAVRQIGETIILGKTKPQLSNVVSAGEADFSKGLSIIIENLISSASPREYLSSLMRDEKLSFGTLSIVLREYSRIIET